MDILRREKQNEYKNKKNCEGREEEWEEDEE
jgi:hypothetical protein